MICSRFLLNSMSSRSFCQWHMRNLANQKCDCVDCKFHSLADCVNNRCYCCDLEDVFALLSKREKAELLLTWSSVISSPNSGRYRPRLSGGWNCTTAQTELEKYCSSCFCVSFPFLINTMTSHSLMICNISYGKEQTVACFATVTNFRIFYAIHFLKIGYRSHQSVIS